MQEHRLPRALRTTAEERERGRTREIKRKREWEREIERECD